MYWEVKNAKSNNTLLTVYKKCVIMRFARRKCLFLSGCQPWNCDTKEECRLCAYESHHRLMSWIKNKTKTKTKEKKQILKKFNCGNAKHSKCLWICNLMQCTARATTKVVSVRNLYESAYIKIDIQISWRNILNCGYIESF